MFIMLTATYKLEKDLCRCCHSEGLFKDLLEPCTNLGQQEIYADMMRECFDIDLTTVPEMSCIGTYMICDTCIFRLRDALNFKKQVLTCEMRLTNLHNKSMVKVIETNVEIEVKNEELDIKQHRDSCDDDLHRNQKNYSEITQAIEAKDLMSRKRTKEASEKIHKDKKGKQQPKIYIKHGDYPEITPKITRMVFASKIIRSTGKRNDLKPDMDTTIQVEIEPVLKKPKVIKADDKKVIPMTITKTAVKIKEKLDNVEKHRENLREILRWSNATPINSHGCSAYWCCYCKNQYNNASELKSHTLENHPNDHSNIVYPRKMSSVNFIVRLDITSLKCNICSTSIQTIEQLKDHLRNVHDKIIHTDIKNHIIPFKFDTEELQCCVCDNTFERFKLLRQHMAVHYRNYVCEICDVGFINYSGLLNHTKGHNIGTYGCDFCPKVFETLIKKSNHVRLAHSKKSVSHKCRYCHQSFNNYNQREAHLISSHGASKPKCKCCDKVFKNLTLLQMHIKRAHLLERRHGCSECDLKFFTVNELKTHNMVRHSGIKPHQCSMCLKSYVKKIALVNHMKTHASDSM